MSLIQQNCKLNFDTEELTMNKYMLTINPTL
jgi:hypothetical protein